MTFSRITIRSLVFATAFLVALSCGGNKNVTQYMSANEHFEYAMNFFKKKNYIRSAEEFLAITYKYSGSEFADDAQFFLAESYYHEKDHVSASAEYERLVSNYPKSQFVEESMYKIVYCYYKLSPDFGLDQKFTIDAMHAAQNFMELYLESPRRDEVEKIFNELREKLARKMYRSAHIYRKLGEYESAIIYYDKVLSTFPTSLFVSDAMFWKAYCYFENDQLQKARLIFSEFIRKYPERKELVKDATKYLKKIEAQEIKKKKASEELVVNPSK